jgi:hypothetical protein
MWRTVDEIAAPKEPKREEGKEPKEPGIGASRTTIKKTLEGNPERFVRKPGDEVGRHANAQVWGLT